MDSAVFEELLISALEKPSKKVLDSLLAQLATAGNPIPAPIIEQLNELWEVWGKDELDDAQGAFCVGLAALPMVDNPVFRKMLIAGVKATLPPYLTRNPIMKAIGIRDENLPLAEISARLRRLTALKNGVIIFLPSAGRWGVAGVMDNINASLTVTPFGGVGSAVAIPLEVVLKDAIILESGPELIRLVDANRQTTAAEFRTIVQRKALTAVPEALMQTMAQMGCARKMDSTEFSNYWKSTASNHASSTTRRSCNSRSLKEMDLLLNSEEASGQKITEEEAGNFKKFFENLKSDTAAREAKLLATIVARITPRAQPEQLKTMMLPLLNKALFWPGTPSKVALEHLSVWGELSAKNLEQLAAATAIVFPEKYQAECAMRIPLKALNALCASISNSMLYELCCENKGCSADFLLWIWKNRKKRPSEELLKLVNVENVVRSLSFDDLPKVWGTALRELRGLLLDNVEFQKQLIKEADGNAMMFAAVLQGALFLSPGERQSLMVKLARISQELRDYLENGAGQRILKAGIGKNESSAPVDDHEPNYTSVKSHKRLMEELDDIINSQIPENREALKVARAHGDFRENSEFDAAKERRNFLNRRRNELERELTRIQPILLKTVRVEDYAVIGSEIELEDENGKKETYQLLGAWDGDPERHFLSYRTRLGKAVLNQKVGSSFSDGTSQYKLVAVRPLSPEIIAELDV